MRPGGAGGSGRERVPEGAEMQEKVKCDVLVAGGGPAGIAAGISAARSGARVVLIERYGFLGGMATAAMVGTICGLYVRNDGGKAVYAVGGFPRQWAERLSAASFSKPIALGNGQHVLPFDPWSFRRLADDALRQTNGLKVALHATLTHVRMTAHNGVEAEALVWDRPVTFDAAAIVDCTGEAVAVRLAGGALHEESTGQTPATVFVIEGASREFGRRGARLAALRHIQRACEKGFLSPDCSRVSFLPSPSGGGKVIVKMGVSWLEGGDWTRMARLEMNARKQIEEMCGFLKKNLAAFKNSYLSNAASQIGIRTGGRARGQVTLTESDVTDCRKWPDAVARGAWPIEEWGDALHPQMTRLPEGEWYDIPAGCLTLEHPDNVFVAGRCISATEKALASARVIATAMGTGWAAGKLASFRALGRDRSAAIEEIQDDVRHKTAEDP